jgi:pyruvate/2-oxoglutarate dehydrogenase complex dihydrolipoamide acyltransferase (E2) component
MKSLKLIGGVAGALLLTAACSAPAPSNNAAANSTAANKAATPAASATPAATPAAASNANASSAAAQDFTLVNETGVEIDKVFISPHDKDDWEEDVLGKDTLPSGQNVEIKFDRDETSAEWDLKVEDKQGNAITWENLNLLKISKLTLHYKDGKATAEAE